MDAILVHVALLNIKAVGRETLARPHEVIRSRLFLGLSRVARHVKGDSEKLASKRWNISLDDCNSIF